MSYARWSCSYWYAYWHAEMSDENEHGPQVLDFCSLCTFTDAAIRANKRACIQTLIEECQKGSGRQPNAADIAEAADIMDEFLADVDRERNTPAAALEES